jgi:hypothetical protein
MTMTKIIRVKKAEDCWKRLADNMGEPWCLIRNARCNGPDSKDCPLEEMPGYKLRPVKARWSDQKHQTVCGRCNAGEDLFDYHDPPLEGKYFATCRICGSRLKRK